jgi:glycosyltransferase involved in cell wall biosynthesis
MRPLVFIVCNALDDVTRIERSITTDSPAASRKIFLMAQALRSAGVFPVVLSLGRGKTNGSCDFFPAKVCRVGGVPVIYAPFSHWKMFSQLLSLFGLLNPLRRFAGHPQRAVIFYNRSPAYLLVLCLSQFLGYRNFLDLEDGEIFSSKKIKNLLQKFVSTCFDRICHHGALLACCALEKSTTVRPVHYYYGTCVGEVDILKWRSHKIRCLMSGTLSETTGAPLLIEVIKRLRMRQPAWASEFCFEVTGKGESLTAFEQLATEPGVPIVRVHGRISNIHYLDILRTCDIGLALKPVGGALADTTFPSKVIEFAGSGLLVLSTDISDVKRLLGDGARYLECNDPELLIEKLLEIASDPVKAADTAHLGRIAVESYCEPLRVGEDLRHFVFGERA